MGERLREVSEVTLRDPIELLGEQADIVADGQQMLEGAPGVGAPAHEGIVVGQPERAEQERDHDAVE